MSENKKEIKIMTLPSLENYDSEIKDLIDKKDTDILASAKQYTDDKNSSVTDLQVKIEELESEIELLSSSVARFG